jgi:hypothetical protein
MVPGIGAGVVTGVYFRDNKADFITSVLFCTLITYSIVTAKKIETMEINQFILQEKINAYATQASEEINNLADDVADDIHEVFVLIADEKFGDDNEEGSSK